MPFRCHIGFTSGNFYITASSLPRFDHTSSSVPIHLEATPIPLSLLWIVSIFNRRWFNCNAASERFDCNSRPSRNLFDATDVSLRVRNGFSMGHIDTTSMKLRTHFSFALCSCRLSVAPTPCFVVLFRPHFDCTSSSHRVHFELPSTQLLISPGCYVDIAWISPRCQFDVAGLRFTL